MTHISGHLFKTFTERKNVWFLLLIAVSLISVNPRINGWNEASRMALTQSIVEHQTLTIDHSTFSGTGDKIFIDGHYFSDKPPVPSMLATLVYFPLYHLGLNLSYGWNLAYYLIILVCIKLLWVFSVIAFQRSLSYMGCEGQKCLTTTSIYAFASQAFTWSATFNNHSMAASCLILGFSFYLSGQKQGGLRDAILAGFFFGLAAAADLPTGLFFLGFGFLIVRSPSPKALKWGFALAGLLPLLIHLSTNYRISGSFLPFQFSREYFEFAGSQWQVGIHANGPLDFLKYGFLSLFGGQGLLWFSPLLLVSIPLLVKRMQQVRPFYQESRVIALCSVLFLSTYFLLTQNFGGWSYGIRWFVPLAPLFYLFLFDVGSILSSRTRQGVFQGLVIYSFLIAIVGLINPWSNHEIHTWPIVANLKQLALFLF